MGNTVTCEKLIDYLIKFSSEVQKVCINEICEYFVARINFADGYNIDSDSFNETQEKEFYEMFNNSPVYSPVYSTGFDKLGSTTVHR